MATSLCPYCGNPVRVGAAFCPNCGRTLPVTQSLIDAPLEPGMLLRNGRYQIEKRLGKGGAGDVYLAQDKQLFNRPVVVKRLRVQETDARDRAEAEHNFEREAQALAELNNPRFPQILDFFIDPPLFYLVMEFVAGEDLDHHLEDNGGPLSEDEVRSIALQMIELLVYLHGQNPPIVHRDIKPANIVINNAGQITLVDFGIARAKMKVGDGKKGAKADSAAWGTPGFAPPEQIAGHAEPASDIFALGATLHQLVTGRDPRDHVGEPFPPADSLIATISPNFSALLARMLNPDPNQRPDAPTVSKELQDLDTLARVAKTSGHLGSLAPVIAPPPSAGPVGALPVQAPPPVPSPTATGGSGFRFPSGDVAMSLREFAGLADRNWADARDGLYGGRVARWLRDLGDRNAAADATAIASSEPTPDVGLETFLERVVPGLPPATLAVDPPQIDVGALRAGGRSRQKLQIRNTSRGALRARLRPSDRWINVEPGAVTCRAGETQDVTVTITTQAGGNAQGSIDVDAGTAGRAQVAVAVGSTAAPAAAPATASVGSCVTNVVKIMGVLFVLILVAFAAYVLLVPADVPTDPTPVPTVALATRVPQATVPVGGLLPPGIGDWAQPGHDSGHTNTAPQDAGPLINAKVKALVPGTSGSGPDGGLLVAQGRVVVALNRILTVYDVQTGGPGWPVGAPGTGSRLLPGTFALGPGRIYAATAGGLAAVDLANGNNLWTRPLTATSSGNLTLWANADGSQSLYLATGKTVSMFADDGTPGWVGPDLTAIGTLRPPVMDQAHVYLSGEVRVVALTRRTGALEWNASVQNTPLSPPVSGVDAVLVEGHGTDNINTLYGLDKSSGGVKWAMPTLEGDLRAPAVHDTTVYVSGDREVAAYDETTGKQVWIQRGLDVGTRNDYLLAEPPVVGTRYLYVATNDGRIFALDAQSGLSAGVVNLHNQDRNLALVHNPVLSNGRLYVGSSNQPTLYEIGP